MQDSAKLPWQVVSNVLEKPMEPQPRSDAAGKDVCVREDDFTGKGICKYIYIYIYMHINI